MQSTTVPTARRDRLGAELVGRVKDPVALARLLREGTSVQLCGPPGVGKSFLARAVGERLLEDGISVLRIRGSAAMIAVPFGALDVALDARLVPFLRDGRPDTAGVLERVAHGLGAREPAAAVPGTAAVSDSAPRRPVVIFVDDAHLLDDSSVDWLSRLCVDGLATVIATADSEGPFGFLWRGGLLQRISVPALDESEALQFVAGECGDRPLDLASTLTIVLNGRGIPMLLRELTAEALACVGNADNDGFSTPADPVDRPAGSVAFARHQLRTLSPHDTAALAVIGATDGIRAEWAPGIIGLHRLDRLARAGFLRGVDTIVPGDDGATITVNPLVGLAAAEEAPRPLVRRGERRLATRIITEVAGGHDIRAGEALLLARCWRDPEVRGRVDAALGPVAISRVFATAAHRLVTIGQAREALGYANLAARLTGSTSPAIARSRAEVALGRPETRSMAEQLSDAHTREGIGAGFGDEDVIDRMSLLQWHGRLEPRRPPVGPPEELRPRAAHLEARMHDPSIALGARVSGGAGAAVLWAFSGDSAKAIETLDFAWATADLIRSNPTAELVAADAWLDYLAGARSNKALAIASSAAVTATADGDLSLQASLGLALGLRALASGDAAGAEIEFRMSAARFRRTDTARRLDVVLALRAQSLAILGESRRAAVLLGEARSIGRVPDAFTKLLFDIAELHVVAAVHGIGPACVRGIRVLHSLRGSPVWEAHLVMAAYVRGTPSARLEPLVARCVAVTDSPLIRLFARVLRADAAEDGAGLDACSRELAALGRLGDALSVAAAAKRIHLAAGDSLAAAASAGHARNLWKESGSPMSEATAVPAHGSALTQRQQEISHLSATGRSNGEIARDLFISVRTVESHLYQARAKIALRENDLLEGVALS